MVNVRDQSSDAVESEVIAALEVEPQRQGVLRLGPICLDRLTYIADSGGAPLPLTRIEFDILAHLMSNAHRVVPQDELVRCVTGRTYSTESSLIRVHVSRLRRKLGVRADLIATVRGRGFRFVPPLPCGSWAEELVPMEGRERHPAAPRP